MAWVGREVGGMTNQSRDGYGVGARCGGIEQGVGKTGDELAKDARLRRVVQRLCDGLRKGKRAKKSIRHA